MTHHDLTTAGRAYALRNARRSRVARVALHGPANGWPPAHVAAAIAACNTAATDEATAVRAAVAGPSQGAAFRGAR